MILSAVIRRCIYTNCERYSHFQDRVREREKIYLKLSNYVSTPFNFRQWLCYQLYHSFDHFVQSRKIPVLVMFGVGVCVFLIYFCFIYTFLNGDFVASKNGVFCDYHLMSRHFFFFDWSTTDMVDIWEFSILSSNTIYITMFILLHAIWLWGPAILFSPTPIWWQAMQT